MGVAEEDGDKNLALILGLAAASIKYLPEAEADKAIKDLGKRLISSVFPEK